jgi:hypothetical protein
MQTKKVRLYINGVRQRDVRPNMTKLQVFIHRVKVFLKVLFWGIITLCFLIAIFEAGSMFGKEKIIYTKQEVIKEVPIKAPILDRIAQAESHKSHYCNEELVKANMCRKSEIGQVLARSNSDKYKSVDVGYYQINLYYWGDKATERGLNLFNEQDNKTMGEWIFQNYGSEPWNSSGENWKK